MHNIGSLLPKQLLEVGIRNSDSVAMAKLLSHKRFGIASGDDQCMGLPPDGSDVVLGSFAASDDANTQGHITSRMVELV